MPWGLPLKKLTKSGKVKGKLTRVNNGVREPLANFLVMCGHEKSITNSKGQYTLPNLEPGMNYLWAESPDENLVSEEISPLPT